MVPRAFGIGALVAALALVPLAVSAGVDLGSLLVAPPGPYWTEFKPGPTVLDGAFTAEDYKTYVLAHGADSAAAANLTNDLNRFGFLAGYGREWDAPDGDAELVERVWQFRYGSGAAIWYADSKRGMQTSAQYSGDIPGIASIPGSVGGVLANPTGSERQFDILFTHGNLFFVIEATSVTADETSLVVGQAKAIYSPSSANPSPAIVPAWVVGAGLLAVLVATWLLGRRMFAARRRRLPAAPPSHGWSDTLS